YEDSKSRLWAAVQDGLWRWKPGPPEFHAMPGELDSLQSFEESDNGALLIGTRDGIRQLVDGKTEAYPLSGPIGRFQTQRLLRDRDGGLWIGTRVRGLHHVHRGRTDVLMQAGGLSGDAVRALFQDREGNVWVATVNGLDRFRDTAVATFTVSQGLSSDEITSGIAPPERSR